MRHTDRNVKTGSFTSRLIINFDVVYMIQLNPKV